jgi:hypothetical protein
MSGDTDPKSKYRRPLIVAQAPSSRSDPSEPLSGQSGRRLAALVGRQGVTKPGGILASEYPPVRSRLRPQGKHAHDVMRAECPGVIFPPIVRRRLAELQSGKQARNEPGS